MSDEIWKIVSKPDVVEVHEGDDARVTIRVAGGPPDQPPSITWIKGKWNELKGPKYAVQNDLDKMEWTLTFKKPKMHDAGAYQVKAISGAGDHCAPFELKLLAQQLSKGKDIKGQKQADNAADAEADAAFKKRMKRMQKTAAKSTMAESSDVWAELTKANPKDYMDVAFQHGITDLRGMLKRLAGVKKKKKDGDKADKEKLSASDLQHPVLKKAKRRGTLTKEDENNLPFEIKLKCGKARKGGKGQS